METKTELGDTSLMPFGKHKGKMMQDVPANYLHWLWTNGLKNNPNEPVAKYIQTNLSALKHEYEDGLW